MGNNIYLIMEQLWNSLHPTISLCDFKVHTKSKLKHNYGTASHYVDNNHLIKEKKIAHIYTETVRKMVSVYIFILILIFWFLHTSWEIEGLVLDFAKRIGYKESRADTINPLGKISFRSSPLNWAHFPLRTINCIISFKYNVFIYPRSCHKRTIMPNGLAGIG